MGGPAVSHSPGAQCSLNAALRMLERISPTYFRGIDPCRCCCVCKVMANPSMHFSVVKKAREEGKKASFSGPFAFIDGQKIEAL